ncbi:hypothetical protein AYO40_06870 [Planctomycetaceae bacterium SCGC AG-212-D15]|nr:hypothetical protein AYO40_06870 [Planctomycetaceae bacterium SCGC AG-212-D15]
MSKWKALVATFPDGRLEILGMEAPLPPGLMMTSYKMLAVECSSLVMFPKGPITQEQFDEFLASLPEEAKVDLTRM